MPPSIPHAEPAGQSTGWVKSDLPAAGLQRLQRVWIARDFDNRIAVHECWVHRVSGDEVCLGDQTSRVRWASVDAVYGDRSEAVAAASEARDLRIASLRRQLARLEALAFNDAPAAGGTGQNDEGHAARER